MALAEQNARGNNILFTNLAPNATQHAFMTEGNARFLQDRVQQALSQATGAEVRVPLDERFVQQMQEVANNSLRPAPGLTGLAAMNRTFIQQLVELQYYSLRHKALFYKYFIDQDRPWVFPVGEYTGGQQVTVSPSDYMLSNPWKRNQASFLQAAVGLRPTGRPAQGATPQGYFFETQQFCRSNPVAAAGATHN